MKCVVAALALLIGVPSVALGATTVSVGGVLLQIPEPNGYVAVTPQMSEVSRVLAQLIPPANAELAAFIPTDQAQTAARGELPDTSRYFIVEVERSTIYSSISSSGFAEVKNNVSETLKENAQRVENQFPDLMKNVNENVIKKYGVKLTDASVNAIPFPIHTDSSNAFAYSMFLIFNIKGASSSKSLSTVIVTTSFVHVKGKILFLYCYSRSGDIAWSRSASEQWAKSVINAN